MADEFTEKRFAALEAKIETIHTHIVGNGIPGLTERVRTIERWVESREALERTVRNAAIGVLSAGTVAATIWIIRAMGA